MRGDSNITITLQISRKPDNILEDQSFCRFLDGFGDNELHTGNLQTKQRKTL